MIPDLSLATFDALQIVNVVMLFSALMGILWLKGNEKEWNPSPEEVAEIEKMVKKQLREIRSRTEPYPPQVDEVEDHLGIGATY